LKNEGYYISVTQAAKSFLAEKGFDPKFGVRPLRRAIAEFVEDPLADLLLSGDVQKGAVIEIEMGKDQLKITSRDTKKPRYGAKSKAA